MAATWIIFVAIAAPSDVSPDRQSGSYCLYVALKALERPIGSLSDLETGMGVSPPAGHSIAGLATAAQKYGVHALEVQTTLDKLQLRRDQFACIAQLASARFLIVVTTDGKLVEIFDPPNEYSVPVDTFLTQWQGKALLLSLNPMTPEEGLGSQRHVVLLLGGLLLLTASVIFVVLRLRRLRA